jgi:hypothetical protein
VRSLEERPPARQAVRLVKSTGGRSSGGVGHPIEAAFLPGREHHAPDVVGAVPSGEGSRRVENGHRHRLNSTELFDPRGLRGRIPGRGTNGNVVCPVRSPGGPARSGAPHRRDRNFRDRSGALRGPRAADPRREPPVRMFPRVRPPGSSQGSGPTRSQTLRSSSARGRNPRGARRRPARFIESRGSRTPNVGLLRWPPGSREGDPPAPGPPGENPHRRCKSLPHGVRRPRP